MAKLKTYQANIKIAPSKVQKMTVQADSQSKARIMLEQQWGKKNVSGLREIK